MKTALVALLVFATSALAEEPTLPANYRAWQHVKSMVIADPKHPLGGFHHVYVEPKALAAFKAGKGYPEGSWLVVPFYEVKDEGGMVQQGALKMVATMKRSAAAKDTGGWVWAAFDPDGKALPIDGKTACFACHAPKKDRDFVFSEWAAK